MWMRGRDPHDGYPVASISVPVQPAWQVENTDMARVPGWLFGVLGLAVGAASVLLAAQQGVDLPFVGKPADAPITKAEARRLSPEDLARRVFGMTAEAVIDVGGVLPVQEPDNLDRSLDRLAFAMPPETESVGLCQADVVAVDFYPVNNMDDQSEAAPFRYRDISMRTVFKVMGKLERGQDYSVVLARKCAEWRPLSDGHFLADAHADAFDSGRVFQLARAEADAERPSFTISCKVAEQCRDRRALLASLETDRIVLIRNPGCHDDVACPLEIMFLTGRPRPEGHAPALGVVKATTFYRGVGKNGWGQLWIKSLEFDDLS